MPPVAMQRICFTLHVRPDALEEYRARHADVWPEMQDALRATGWRNHSLFLRGDEAAMRPLPEVFHGA